MWSGENEDDLVDDGISTPIIWAGISFLGGFFFLGADWIVLALICFTIPFLQSRLELGREDNHSEYLARSLHKTNRLVEHQICLL